jgi:hypothetical protein
MIVTYAEDLFASKGIYAQRATRICTAGEKAMNKRLRILFSVLSGVASGAAALAFIVVFANVSIIWTFRHVIPATQASETVPVGPSFFLSPVILAVGVGISVAVGLLAYSFARTRLRTPDRAER